MKFFIKILFRLLVFLLLLPLILLIVVPVAAFIIVMAIWDRIWEIYMRRYRPDIVAREEAQMAEMDMYSTLCIIIQEMIDDRRPWKMEDFEALLMKMRNSRAPDEYISRGENEGYWIRVGHTWKLTDKGREFADDYSRSIGR